MVKIKIAWKGAGWYAGRYDEDENIIVERVADYELSRAEVLKMMPDDRLNISSYGEPPPYMEILEEK